MQASPSRRGPRRPRCATSRPGAAPAMNGCAPRPRAATDTEKARAHTAPAPPSHGVRDAALAVLAHLLAGRAKTPRQPANQLDNAHDTVWLTINHSAATNSNTPATTPNRTLPIRHLSLAGPHRDTTPRPAPTKTHTPPEPLERPTVTGPAPRTQPLRIAPRSRRTPQRRNLPSSTHHPTHIHTNPRHHKPHQTPQLAPSPPHPARSHPARPTAPPAIHIDFGHIGTSLCKTGCGRAGSVHNRPSPCGRPCRSDWEAVGDADDLEVVEVEHRLLREDRE